MRSSSKCTVLRKSMVNNGVETPRVDAPISSNNSPFSGPCSDGGQGGQVILVIRIPLFPRQKCSYKSRSRFEAIQHMKNT